MLLLKYTSHINNHTEAWMHEKFCLMFVLDLTSRQGYTHFTASRLSHCTV